MHETSVSSTAAALRNLPFDRIPCSLLVTFSTLPHDCFKRIALLHNGSQRELKP
jgi:hypothetical protein